MNVLRHRTRRAVWLASAIVSALTVASAVAERPQSGPMNYRVVEEYYGPDIRFTDWRITRGDLATDHEFHQTRGVWRPGGEGVDAFFSAGGAIQIYATGEATVTRQDYIYGGGGDVEVRVRFEIERIGEDGSFAIRLNDSRTGSDGKQGFRVRVDPGEAVFYYREDEVGRAVIDTRRGVVHDLVFATLADKYLFRIDGEAAAAGRMERHSQDNEGWTHLDVGDAGVRILSFQENFIVYDRDFEKWTKADLLYAETFGKDSWERNWVLNGVAPTVADDSFIFHPMSNMILDRKFDGPVAIEIEATPVPSDAFSAGLTDAIFMWMMEHPGGDLPGFMRGLPDANRHHYDRVAFYWMDFGGTNNVTTRQRRSPNLRMVRQFTDRPRLLSRDTTYAVTLVQKGTAFEFWVDGEPWIRAHDPEPLDSGHIGFRSFNSELRITGLKVWRIE